MSASETPSTELFGICTFVYGSGQMRFEKHKQRCGAMFVTGEMLAIESFQFDKTKNVNIILTELSVCGGKNAWINK